MERVFVQLLNGDVICELGEDARKERIGENVRVVRKVVRKKMMRALKKIKGAKAAGMDGIVVEIWKNGGIVITDWYGDWCCARELEGSSVYRSDIQMER